MLSTYRFMGKPSTDPARPLNTKFKPLETPTSIRLLKMELIMTKSGVEMQQGYTQDDIIILETREEVMEARATGKQIFVQPHMQNFDLKNCPEFGALSYTWGDPIREGPAAHLDNIPSQPPKMMSFCLGEGLFDIPCNLWGAVNQLAVNAYMSPQYKTKWIWADSICINQRDPVEKARQVAMMGEIYRAASTVYVWLGEDTTHFHSFVWMVTVFSKALTNYMQNNGGSVDVLRGKYPYDPKLLAEIGVSPPGQTWGQCWASYFEFYRRRAWFTRSWIVQEVALAKNVVIECGPNGVSWSHVSYFTSILFRLGWDRAAASLEDKSLGLSTGQEMIRICRIQQYLEDYRKPILESPCNPEQVNSLLNYMYSSPQSYGLKLFGLVYDSSFQQPTLLTRFQQEVQLFSEVPVDSAGHQTFYPPVGSGSGDPPGLWFFYFQLLLAQSRRFVCSDARDKIYAYLGILQSTLPPMIKMPILPDYTSAMTATKLYTSVTALLLTRTFMLSTLSYVEDKANKIITDLPSWVPDYSCTKIPEAFRSLRIKESFDCCSRTFGKPTLTIYPDCTLALGAALFDEIVEVSIPISEALRLPDVSSLLAVAAHGQAPYTPTGQDLSEVLWRTLIADTYQNLPAQPLIGQHFKEWMATHIAPLIGFEAELSPESEQKIQGLLQPFEEKKTDNDAYALPSIGDIIAIITETRKSQSIETTLEQLGELDNPELVAALKTPEVAMARIERQAEPFAYALQTVMEHRSLFRTRRGYLGLCPQSTRIGDGVWALKSAVVPFILRRKEHNEGNIQEADPYILMGEAYLHGYMFDTMGVELADKIELIRLV